MTTFIYIAMAAISVVLWAPICVRFYRAWFNRKNPVSLAIFAIILLLIWFAVAGIWLVTGDVARELVAIVSTALSASVALYTHFAFYWSTQKFPDQRRPTEK